MIDTVSSVPQSFTQKLDIVQRAQTKGTFVEIGDDGNFKVANFGARIAAKFEGWKNGADWRAEREANRNRAVLENLATALEGDAHAPDVSQRELSAWKKISGKAYSALEDFRNSGTLPAAERLRELIGIAANEGIESYEKDQDRFATQAMNEWKTGTPNEATKAKLARISDGTTKGYEKYNELKLDFDRLAAKTERLRTVYLATTIPSDDQAQELADYENATQAFGKALDEANALRHANRHALKGDAPEHTTVAVVKPHVRVKFAGEDTGISSAGAADETAHARASAHKGDTIFVTDEEREAGGFADDQPKPEGNGKWKVSQMRSEADLAAANKAWENYGKDNDTMSSRPRSGSTDSTNSNSD